MPRRKVTEDPVLRETKCCICGRVFIPAPQHVYHRTGKWCCKWTCFCRLLDEIELKKKKTGRPEGYSQKKRGEKDNDRKEIH